MKNARGRALSGTRLTVGVTAALVLAAVVAGGTGETKLALVLGAFAVALPVFAIGNRYLGEDDGRPAAEADRKKFNETWW